MNVLGKGKDRLNLPPELQSHVSVHRRLPFQGFYTVICHTLVSSARLPCVTQLDFLFTIMPCYKQALVPSLASARYFTSKFSSTIITSLSTGTPIIATKELLASYTFFDKDSVFAQVKSLSSLLPCQSSIAPQTNLDGLLLPIIDAG